MWETELVTGHLFCVVCLSDQFAEPDPTYLIQSVVDNPFPFALQVNKETESITSVCIHLHHWRPTAQEGPQILTALR